MLHLFLQLKIIISNHNHPNNIISDRSSATYEHHIYFRTDQPLVDNNFFRLSHKTILPKDIFLSKSMTMHLYFIITHKY